MQPPARHRPHRLPALSPLARLAALGALVLAGLLAAGPGAAAAAPCPSFRVLHNDRIGSASLPAGSYAVEVTPGSGLTCGAAAKLFARFLEDYDGVLPRPWAVRAEGTGRASFAKGGSTAFTVSRSGAGTREEREGGSPLGVLCPTTYTVNAAQRVGVLAFARGRYLVYLPPGSALSCRRAAVLFTRFLASPGGALPRPWALNAQIATFYKPASPLRSAFRIEPFAGPLPA